MEVKPQREHQWLEWMIGNWTYESTATMGPDQSPMTWRGTEVVRSMGGVWVLCEGQGEIPGGGTGNMLMTLGFDPASNRFVGTFIGSMMTYLWVYSGALDAAEKILTLDAEGPNFDQSGLAKYQDTIELVSDDHRILSSRIQNADGSWNTFMSGHYHRQK